MSGIRGGFRNPLVTGASIPPGTIDSGHLADGAVTSLKLGVNLQSDNYDGGVVSVDPGTQGWRIERTTGDIAVNNAFIRGILEASIFRTAASGERLVLDGSNNETFITIFNSSDQVVGQMGFAPTGWGSDQMVFYGGSGTGGVVIGSDGDIELQAAGSSGQGVVITNASPSGGIPGKPFVVAGVMRLHNSTSEATPTWARDADPDTGIVFPASNTLGLVTGANERWRVDSSGRFIFPSAGSNTTNRSIGFQPDQGVSLELGSTVAGSGAVTPFIDFHTGASQDYQVRLIVSGTGTATGLLSINGGAVELNGTATTTNNTLPSWRHANTGNPYRLLPLVSSARFKRNIEDIPDRDRLIEDVRRFRVRRWHEKGPRGGARPGWIRGIVAEEAAEIWPDLVGFDQDGRPLAFDPATAFPIPLLVVAQDLLARVEALESRAA